MSDIRTRGALLYYDSTNKQFGAGQILEAPALKIFFYEVKYWPRTKEIYISGRVHVGISQNDTFGLGGVSVLLAKPYDTCLVNIRRLSESNYTYKDSTINEREEGLFKFRIRVKEGDNLYFIAESWYVAEYKLGMLIGSCNRKKKRGGYAKKP